MAKQKKRSSSISRRHKAAISEGVKHYWNYMNYLQKKFSGNTAKEKRLRSQVEKLYNVKVGRSPDIHSIRKMYIKIRTRRQSVRKKIKKDVIELYGNERVPLEAEQLDRYVNELYRDTEEGSFEDEIKT